MRRVAVVRPIIIVLAFWSQGPALTALKAQPAGSHNALTFSTYLGGNSNDVVHAMAVDSQGNVYGSGPGGLWVFSPDGKHLGTIKPPETPANCGWADDGKTLYITARTGVYRIKLAVAGEKPLYQ